MCSCSLRRAGAAATERDTGVGGGDGELVLGDGEFWYPGMGSGMQGWGAAVGIGNWYLGLERGGTQGLGAGPRDGEQRPAGLEGDAGRCVRCRRGSVQTR